MPLLPLLQGLPWVPCRPAVSDLCPTATPLLKCLTHFLFFCPSSFGGRRLPSLPHNYCFFLELDRWSGRVAFIVSVGCSFVCYPEWRVYSRCQEFGGQPHRRAIAEGPLSQPLTASSPGGTPCWGPWRAAFSVHLVGGGRAAPFSPKSQWLWGRRESAAFGFWGSARIHGRGEELVLGHCRSLRCHGLLGGRVSAQRTDDGADAQLR